MSTHIRTPEHNRKIAEANRGSKRSLEARRKISEAAMGRPAWNKGLKLPDQSGANHAFYGKKHALETVEKMSNAKKGNKNRLGKTFTLESRKKMSATKLGKHYSSATEFTSERASAINKGRVRSAETRNKISEAKKGQTPWNKGLGTISSANELARKTKQARDWRKSVFERDNYTCQECHQRGGVLNADHIKQFAYYPEFRYEIGNGRTLCMDCHRKTDTWGRKTTNGVFNLVSS